MGQLRFEAEEYAEAAEDWLSAASCFLLAASRKQAADILEVVHRMETAGKLPADRPDLHDALRKHEQELKKLDQAAQPFLS
jgi:hypothetical protein